MPTLAIMIALLILGLIALRAYLRSDPRKLAKTMRRMGGIGALALAVLLTLTGRFGLASIFAMISLGLLGVSLIKVNADSWGSGGREDIKGDAARRRGPGAMSEQEALDILGLKPGASEQQIRDAHRALIKKLHPDQGGTSGLAARINEARDVLIR